MYFLNQIIVLTKIQQQVVQHIVANWIIISDNPVQIWDVHQGLPEPRQFRQLLPARICGRDKVDNRHIRRMRGRGGGRGG